MIGFDDLYLYSKFCTKTKSRFEDIKCCFFSLFLLFFLHFLWQKVKKSSKPGKSFLTTSIPPDDFKIPNYNLPFRKAAENTKQRKHRRRKIQSQKRNRATATRFDPPRRVSTHRDAFRPCSRVSSGGRISRETN